MLEVSHRCKTMIQVSVIGIKLAPLSINSFFFFSLNALSYGSRWDCQAKALSSWAALADASKREDVQRIGLELQQTAHRFRHLWQSRRLSHWLCGVSQIGRQERPCYAKEDFVWAQEGQWRVIGCHSQLWTQQILERERLSCPIACNHQKASQDHPERYRPYWQVKEEGAVQRGAKETKRNNQSPGSWGALLVSLGRDSNI